ncbi:MAG: hypothetical protein QOC65_1566, partial [Sphingomonadales bacterium]|nr:hypothetical protein [Sphingomonadales bacterium]
FDRRLREVPRAHETALPATRSAAVRVRFQDGWLLYGDLAYEFELPWNDGAGLSSELIAVPLARPAEPRRVRLPHNLVSIGEAGRFAFATGYRDRSGLMLSIVDLRDQPRLVSTLLIEGRRQQSGSAERISVRGAGGGSLRIDVPTVDADAVLPEGPRGDRPGESVPVWVAPDGTLRLAHPDPQPAVRR